MSAMVTKMPTKVNWMARFRFKCKAYYLNLLLPSRSQKIIFCGWNDFFGEILDDELLEAELADFRRPLGSKMALIIELLLGLRSMLVILIHINRKY